MTEPLLGRGEGQGMCFRSSRPGSRKEDLPFLRTRTQKWFGSSVSEMRMSYHSQSGKHFNDQTACSASLSLPE